MKVLTVIKNHKWAIILAVLAGIIIALPQFCFRYNDSYQGIDMPLTGAELFYWSRIQEVRDGYPSLGNVWLSDYKDRPYIQPPLGEIMTAYLGKIFNLDINNTVLLARVVFPALIVLAVYAFVYFFIKKKYVALIASTGLVLTDGIITRPFILNLLKWRITDYQALGYGRPVIPEVSSLLFFGSLLFFWLFWIKERKIFGILSGVLLGMSFYVFFYTWSLMFAFMGILGLFCLFKKEWLDLKKIFLVIIVTMIVAIPYLLNLFQSMQYSEFLDSSHRTGLIESHRFTPAYLIPAVLIIFLIIFPRAWKKRYLFGAALLASLLVAINEQLITGKELISGHYHWYYSRPLAWIFMTIIFFYLLEKIISSSFLKKIIIGAIIVTFILNGLIVGSIDYFYRIQQDTESIVYQQRYGPVLKWLNANAKKDDAVLANTDLSILIAVYTPFDAPHHSWSNLYLVPQKELLDLTFFRYRLRGVKPEDAREIFLKEKGSICWQVFGDYYRQKLGESEYTPDEVIYPFIKEYQDFSKTPIEKLFQRYSIKYAVWDQAKEPEWVLNSYPFLKEVYQKDKIRIYQVQI